MPRPVVILGRLPRSSFPPNTAFYVLSYLAFSLRRLIHLQADLGVVLLNVSDEDHMDRYDDSL